jgi:hypothetical protein
MSIFITLSTFVNFHSHHCSILPLLRLCLVLQIISCILSTCFRNLQGFDILCVSLTTLLTLWLVKPSKKILLKPTQ